MRSRTKQFPSVRRSGKLLAAFQREGAGLPVGQRFQMGMNQPGSDDKQFALNVLRWLAGALDR